MIKVTDKNNERCLFIKRKYIQGFEVWYRDGKAYSVLALFDGKSYHIDKKQAKQIAKRLGFEWT